MALSVTVDFVSPVNEGDDVEMTCAYNNPGSNNFQLLWRRKTSPDLDFKTIWIYFGSENSATDKEFESNFEYIPQLHHDETSHKIKLLDAKKNDKGLYMCSVYVINVSIVTSSEKKQLDEGE